jgi:hypothetical protein
MDHMLLGSSSDQKKDDGPALKGVCCLLETMAMEVYAKHV